jgi:histidinol-phosphate aminotransferase
VFVAEARPTLVFVCSPNNPTGTVEPASTIEALLDATDGLVIVDEAYGEFAPRSALELVRDDRPLVVVRTYSKVWSMAALRLGFAVAPPWVVEELEKVVLPYHLASATQIAGRLALDLGAEMDDRVRRLVAERERVAAELAGVAGIECYPSGANFLLFRVAGDGHELWERLVARGVLVRDFSRWPRLAECLRVTIGTAEENDAFLAALRASLQEAAA